MRFLRHICSWISLTLLLSTCSRADEHHKRIPSGFTGVRGKKSIPDEAYNSEDVEDSNAVDQKTEESQSSEIIIPSSPNYLVQKRAPSGFFGMRGKKQWFSYPEEIYKRAPMGFVGMRGKKENDDDSDLAYAIQYIPLTQLRRLRPPDKLPKRAQMGFFGMRGKKYSIDSGFQGIKRAPMGFIGMRGKKDLENPSGYFEDNKRAPSGFFGMRGKKHPSGFFGMRGKKYPYEFRGKFVGVRGKKSSDITVSREFYPEPVFTRLSDDLDFNQLMLLLTQQNEAGTN